MRENYDARLFLALVRKIFFSHATERIEGISERILTYWISNADDYGPQLQNIILCDPISIGNYGNRKNSKMKFSIQNNMYSVTAVALR